MHFLAALLAAMPLLANGEAQLLPAGEFAAVDGRPGAGKFWKLTDLQGAALAVKINARLAKAPMSIDYEHQSVRAEVNGQPAPAAGWITAVEWRPGMGLFSAVDWTDKAKAFILAKEYRFISPVMFYTPDGQVTGLHNAALVSSPALLGMEAVMAQLSAKFSPTTNDQQEIDMLLLAALLAAIGLPADTTEAAALAHITTLKDTAAAAGAKVEMPKALLSALALDATATEAQVVSAVAALKATSPEMLTLVTGLQGQVAELSAQANERSLLELVDGAIMANKFTPAQRDSFLALGRKDMAALSAIVAAAPVIHGLAGQSGGKGPGDPQAAALSAQGAAVMASFGLTAEQFAKGAPPAA